MSAPAKQAEAGTRNPDGTFPKGVSGNPNGRPVFSIVSILKEYLQEVPEGQKKARAMQLVEEITTKAIVDKDTAMMRDILDRIDGKPKQDVGIGGVEGGQPLEIRIKMV